jgi:hypothetical protein
MHGLVRMAALQRQRCGVKVRIKRRPQEREVDGVSLRSFYPGAVREVSPLLGAWLIAAGYADSEMRVSHPFDGLDNYFTTAPPPPIRRDRRRS